VAFGLIAYAVLHAASGRARSVHPLVYLFAGLFVARYAFLR
jgi:AGZA family xanthine/uracil permease-like MFS transporter